MGEFDVNESKPKKAKKKKKKEKIIVKEPTPSPQPNQITDIPEPVVSFDAPFGTEDDNEDDNLNDNPFGDDAPMGDHDDDEDDDDMFDGDNPFASAFDEPDNNAQTTSVIDEFDPF